MNGENQQNVAPDKPPEATQGATLASTPSNSVSSSGRRQAFDDVLNPLTSEELSSPGTQKLILYMLQRSQGDCDELEAYMERFHEADKRASILQEKLDSAKKISNATEIAVIVGTTMGGALVGLGTYFWGKKEPDIYSGWIAILVGVVLIIGAVAVKIAKK